MKELILLLGGNLGDVELHFQKAIYSLNKALGEVEKKSSVYKTAAWGKTDQPDFLNQVVSFKTNVSAAKALAICLEVEDELGRIRYEKWGERTIDIDILFYENEIIDIKGLIIPHPRLHERLFTLKPLAEIHPKFIHPVFNKTIVQLLETSDDTLAVNKL